MLSFLLDEHLSPSIATAVKATRPTIAIQALQTWRAGNYLAADDAAILRAAAADGITIVTFDLRTIPPLLRAWTEQGVAHGGVIFVHRQSIRPSDVGGIARALVQVWDASGGDDWADRVVFLRSPS
ncbi:MAG: DUF5615 family PIN-like protein [Ardenticatenales bacterium]|nr:DUF5615 family PIN-like protein [Ardenticatenales bacterium]